MLTVECLKIQNKYIKENKYFFPISQNKFLHKDCNSLTIDELVNIKKKQERMYRFKLFQLLKEWEKNNIVLDCEKLTLAFRFILKYNKCDYSDKQYIICQKCKKVINCNYVKTHSSFCKIKECTFEHADGRKCDCKLHKENIHMNFVSNNEINFNTHTNITKKHNNIFSQNSLNDLNTIIVFKTNKIYYYISYLLFNFKDQYDIFTKRCICFLKLKSCQCFRYILNNVSVNKFLKRSEKNVYKCIKEYNECYMNSKIKIGIIIVDKQLGNIIKQNFSFFSTYRKNKFLKIIFIHNLKNCLFK